MRATRLHRIVAGLALSVVLAAGAVFAFWGQDDEPVGGVAAPGGASVEAGFSRDMVVHHQQAVEMSLVVRDSTTDKEVRILAYDIINTQAAQRGMMLGWLEMRGLEKSSSQAPMAWMGHSSQYRAKEGSLMPGMATDTQINQLNKARGVEAEVLYLKLMTAHHKAGVDMARAAEKAAKDQGVKRLAQSMVDGQQAEMDLMATMLAQRGAAAAR
ncbi:DUF305 domain-containing protein [Streptomyces cyaneofuscatus]|uniref:DUF305 domain-containing protein n=1 Tax=Streptomyces cyaneofuscatus TaxID=66883 RepID=UPI003CE6E0A3